VQNRKLKKDLDEEESEYDADMKIRLWLKIILTRLEM
jgi:hypothetical protein